MEALIEFAISIAISALLGSLVPGFLERAANAPEGPDGLSSQDWNDLTTRSSGGKHIGDIERIITIVAAAKSEYSIVAAWLAFKVAAKWETWNNIIKVPAELNGVKPLDWFKARSALGSWILSRFLVGTAVNVLIGFLAWYLGSHTWELAHAICQ